MAMQKIKKGDFVMMRCGRDKGRTGRVSGLTKDGSRVIVEGLNLVKKHVKPNPQKNEAGGILSKEASVTVSNVGIVNPRTKKADRVGFKKLEDGRKVRYFKSDKEIVDV